MRNQSEEESDDPMMEGYSGVSSRYQKPADAEFARFILEMEEEIKARVLHLEGYYEDRDGKLVKFGDPLLNAEGTRFANRQMRHFAGKTPALANMEGDRIAKFVLYHDRMVRHCLLSNIRNFSPQAGCLLPTSTLKEVKSTIIDIGYLNLTRSDEDLERQRMYRSHNVTESHQYDNAPLDRKRHGISMW
jgi:hypothetical protein